MQTVRQDMVPPYSRSAKDLPYLQNHLLGHSKEGKDGKSTMKTATQLGVLLLLTASAFAKDKTMITVSGSEENVSQRAYFIPGSNGYATTNCNGNATAVTSGPVTTVSGNANCNTTVTPARAPMVGVRNTRGELVDAVTPTGTHIMLKCQQGWRRCAALEAGSYPAELNGDYISVFADDNNGKEHKIKYHIVGGAAAYR